MKLLSALPMSSTAGRLAIFLAAGLGSPASAQDASAPAILQAFEASWETLESRTIDSFYAGYGGLWIPPTGRADSGDQSVGYDVFDRFDLGSAGNPTLYGTETGLKALTEQARRAGQSVYADLILNHNGFSDNNRPGFIEAGDYPGFVLENDADRFGDFHPPVFDGNDVKRFRLAGLVDIDQSTNFRYIRTPVNAGDPRNIPAGTVYDRPDPNNARFYPDQALGSTTAFDPDLNQNVTLYDFNRTTPLAGDAVEENALGLMLRSARWLIQEVGVDGFRLDAVKHYDPYVLEFLDQAVHNAADPLLDGSENRVFSFGEVFTGDQGLIQSYVQDVDRGPDRVGGNRDALDFPLFFAMRNNLTDNGLENDWREITNASFDGNDDGLANNGSQGVAHVASHDEGGPALSNVAHAYTLLRPGNANVYFNAKEFGDGRDFPKDGRGDALGGSFGDTITKLVDIRNTHGRGNYLDRTPAGDEKETLIYERENSALVVLSNRLDAGFDSRTVETSFAPGTLLLELTGNAEDAAIDPFDDFPSVVRVNDDGTVNLRVLRNVAPDGNRHDTGYLIYGLAGPQGVVSLSNVSQTLPGRLPTTNASNGTTRLGDVDVVTADRFDVTLNTNAVNLLGNPALRDRDADGDAAYLKLDAGLDLNRSGSVDFVAPGGLLYGFENFADVNDAGFFNADGNGTFRQSIDTTQLAEGYHFLTARAFRHRDASTGGDGGPAVFEDFRRAVYVDRLDPESELASVEAFSPGGHDLDFRTRSTDGTATETFTFLNLGAAVGDAEILSRIDADPDGSSAQQIDRDLFQRGFFDVAAGTNALTVVTREVTGRTNVQRLLVDIDNGNGAGRGDVNRDGSVDDRDLANSPFNFETVLYSRDAIFNPGADLNRDGRVDNRDLFAFRGFLTQNAADPLTVSTYGEVLLRRGNVDGRSGTDASDIDFLFDRVGTNPSDPALAWLYDLDVDGAVTSADVDTLVRQILVTEYGDADLDGEVEADDFDTLADAYNTAGGWALGDFTGDGRVAIADLNLLAVHYGNGFAEIRSLVEGSGLAVRFDEGLARFVDTVPEPATAVLAGLGGLLLLRRRRPAA